MSQIKQHLHRLQSEALGLAQSDLLLILALAISAQAKASPNKRKRLSHLIDKLARLIY